MTEILTLPQPAQTRKSTKDRKAPRQRRKPPRFLTEPQVEGLRQMVKKTSRNPHRDSTMILVAYRHGLRVGELTDLRWEDVHLDLLRHGCGYRLVNQGANTRTIQDDLGHRDPRHTGLYTAVDASRFRGLWRRTGSER